MDEESYAHHAATAHDATVMAMLLKEIRARVFDVEITQLIDANITLIERYAHD